MKNYIDNLKKKEFMTILLWVMVITQFCFIGYTNFFHSEDFLDLDTGIAIKYGVDMWRNGIFSECLHYSTSLEIDCASFFAAPIYLLTNNLGLALGLVHCVFYVWIICLMRAVSVNSGGTENGFLLAVLLFFTPYASEPGILEWSNMIFLGAGYYEVRVICMLSILNVLLLGEKEHVSMRRYGINLLVCCIVNFWTSLSAGNFGIGMIVLPFVLLQLLQISRTDKLEWKQRNNLGMILIVLSCLVGMAVRVANVPFSHRNNLPLVHAGGLIGNMFNSVAGIFMLFNAAAKNAEDMLLSSNGILILCRFAMVVLWFIVLWYEGIIRKNRSTFIKACSLLALVNMGIFTVTDTQYGSAVFERRYHIVWCSLLLVFAANALMKKAPSLSNVRIFALRWGVVALAAVINLAGFQEIVSYRGSRWYESKVIRLAEQWDVDDIIIYGDSAKTSVFSAMCLDRHVTTVYWTGEKTAAIIFDTYNCNGEHEYVPGKHMFICDRWDFDGLPEHIKSNYTLIDESIVGPGHTIFISEENPWDGVSGLPCHCRDISVDYPYSPGYRHSGTINENGQLAVASEKNEYILTGPYVRAIPGVYDITVYYQVVKEGTSDPFFDISAQNGENILIKGNLPTGQTSMTLEGVSILGTGPMEYRIWQAAGGSILIDKIVFERVGEN